MVLPVGAGLGLERRLDCGEMRAKAAQHLFQYAIPPDAQPLAQDLNIGVAVSDMPGEPRKLLRTSRRDLDQRLALAGNQYDGTVVEQEAVAVVQHGRVRKMSRTCVPRSPLKTTRRRWRSSASSTTRSMMRDRSILSARQTDDARRNCLFKLAILGKKREVQHLVCFKRAFRWKDSHRKACVLAACKMSRLKTD